MALPNRSSYAQFNYTDRSTEASTIEESNQDDPTTVPTFSNATIVSQSMSPETKFTTKKRQRSWDDSQETNGHAATTSRHPSPLMNTEEQRFNLEKQRQRVELSISNMFDSFQSTIENLRLLLKEKDEQIESLKQQIQHNTRRNKDIDTSLHQKDTEIKQLKGLLKEHQDLVQSQSVKLSQATKPQQSQQETIISIQSLSSSTDKDNEIEKLISERSDMIKRLGEKPKLIKEIQQLKSELKKEREKSSSGELEQLVSKYNLKHNNIHDDESTAHIRKLLVTTRQSLERSVQKQFQKQLNIPLPPYDMALKDLIKSLKERQVPSQLIDAMHTIREYGNKAIHDENIPSREQVQMDLANLVDLEDAFEKGLLR